MRRVIAIAAGLLCITAAGAQGAAAPQVFETISLTSLTAADVAPQLAPVYRVAGAPAPPAEQPAPAATIVPAEVKLVTAGNPDSQLLLVYGPEKAIRDLAQAVGKLDVPPAKPEPPPGRVRLSLTMNGTLPREMGDWTPGPELGGLTTRVKDFGESASLRYRRGQRGYEMGSAFAVLRAGAPELIALPKLGPLPQLLIGVKAKVNPDDTITLSLGLAQAEEKSDPWKVIDEANNEPLVITVKQRQQLAVALLRDDSGVTFMFSTSEEKPETKEAKPEAPPAAPAP